MEELETGDEFSQMHIHVGDYVLSRDEDDELWLNGPKGDGMCLGTKTEKALEAVLAQFFSEHM